METIHTWQKHLECGCNSKGHIFVLEYDQEWGLSISLQARQYRSFFRRCLVAFKYIFNLDAPRGAGLGWDTSLVKPEDLPKIREWIAQADMYGIGEDFNTEEMVQMSDIKQ